MSQSTTITCDRCGKASDIGAGYPGANMLGLSLQRSTMTVGAGNPQTRPLSKDLCDSCASIVRKAMLDALANEPPPAGKRPLRSVRIEAADIAHLSRIWVDGTQVTNVVAYAVEAGVGDHGPNMTTVTLTFTAACEFVPKGPF